MDFLNFLDNYPSLKPPEYMKTLLAEINYEVVIEVGGYYPMRKGNARSTFL